LFFFKAIRFMDPTTASYYRAILFLDGQDQRPVPKSLVELHAWAVKRGQAMGLGSMITKQAALTVATTWMSTTKEGREFTREFTPLGEMFSEPDAVPAAPSDKAKPSRMNQGQLVGV
jgi:polysaccharide deacetylase 2 family uncharacterized protein YibQ